MCCFSGPARTVERVSGTHIFATARGGADQALAYSMNISARSDVAMILPLPVPPGASERAVRFVDLSGYATFFSDMRSGFPPIVVPLPRPKGAREEKTRTVRLTVHRVGSFEASFVPSLQDFDRLDPRFRIAQEVWDEIPHYSDYGFAVFKLRGWRTSPWRRFLDWTVTKTIHPMAFEFPRRDPATVFFPTLHIHDGTLEDEAAFDHSLFLQPEQGHDVALRESHVTVSSSAPRGEARESEPLRPRRGSGQEDFELWWELSEKPTDRYMRIHRTAGLVRSDAPILRRVIKASWPNGDILVRSTSRPRS